MGQPGFFDAERRLAALSKKGSAARHDADFFTGIFGNHKDEKAPARFAAVRVRIADGPPQRIRDKGQQHLNYRP